MSAPVEQWLRSCRLKVGTGGNGIEIGATETDPGHRIKFEIDKTIGRVPNVAKILVYNLSPGDEGRIAGEYTDVLLSAGYKGAEQLVFRGNLRRTFRYREDNNWITQIDAADGVKDYDQAIVSVTLQAGATNLHALDHLTRAMTSTRVGHVALTERKYSRGRVLCGMVRDKLDPLAADDEAHWSIQDGALQIVPADSTLPTEAIVVNAETGMTGAPEVTNDGIKAKCLLNPEIHINGKIWLDNNDLKARIAREREKKKTAAVHAKAPAKKKELARLDPDGIYKVIKLSLKGDTRGSGGDWVTEAVCVGLDKAIPAGKRTA